MWLLTPISFTNISSGLYERESKHIFKEWGGAMTIHQQLCLVLLIVLVF